MATIANGYTADANEVICAYFKPQAINSGQNFINAMKVATPNTTYTLIQGRNFTCNSGNVTVIDYTGSSYILKNSNFCDTFASTGCWSGLTPTQYIGIPTSNGTKVAFICVCATSCLCIYGNSCATGTVTTTLCGCRPYADCYKIIFAAGADPYSTCNSTISLQLGDAMIYCCVYAEAQTLACKTYEFRRIANTNCYCYLCNSSLVCCFASTMTSGVSYKILASAVGSGSNDTYACLFVYNPTIECYTGIGTTIDTADNTFSSAPAYILVTAFKTETTGNLRYKLLCTDGTELCTGLLVDTPYNVEAINLCTYKLRFYNDCICTNTTSNVSMTGYALMGANRT